MRSSRSRFKDGDEIGIGSTSFRFLCDPAAGEAGAGEDRTRAASEPEGERKSSLGQALVQKKEGEPLQVKLRISGGPLDGGVFKDWEGPLMIGRSLDNHVVLLDD